MERIAVLFLLILCACVSPHPIPPRTAHADADWYDHVGALIVRIRSPDGYITIPNAYPFVLYIDLLETSPYRWQPHDPFVPIEQGAGRETVWNGDVRITAFLNTERFVRHGYIAIRPTGLTRVPNPLRSRCPRNLIQAAVTDMEGDNLLILEPHLVGRVERHGCLYRFRYLVDSAGP